MSKQMNIPKLRFPEFNEPWVEKGLSDLLEFKNGINASIEQYGRGVKFINVLDILNNDFITHDKIIGSVDVEQNIVEKYAVNYGDILFQRSSETREEVGSANVYLDKEHTATFGGFVIRGRKIGNYNPVFLNKLLKTNASRDAITSKSGGSTRYNVGQDILSSVKLLFPEMEEQTKIADFLFAIDEKNKSLKKKKSLLEAYKKGVMQRIFLSEKVSELGLVGLEDDRIENDEEKVNPTIHKSYKSKFRQLRFKDENGKDFPEWEVKKLGEVCEKQSSSISANKIEENYGVYPIYGAAGILKKVDFYEEENDYISIVKDGASVGRLLYCNGKSSVLGTLDIIKSKINLNTYFLYCLLNNIDFTKYVTGSTIPHIYFKDYKNETCGIPSFPEQTLIANFLSSLDEKIQAAQVQIDKMEAWKRGLLQKMFV